MIELRQNTSQIIPVGVLLGKRAKFIDDNEPVYGAALAWYFWRCIIKADGIAVDIETRTWSDINYAAGYYNLTVLSSDVNLLGPLTVYIFDSSSLEVPVVVRCMVVNQNYYDSKYGPSLLRVESQAELG